jgi:Tfp pilus assembly protein PilF
MVAALGTEPSVTSEKQAISTESDAKQNTTTSDGIASDTKNSNIPKVVAKDENSKADAVAEDRIATEDLQTVVEERAAGHIGLEHRYFSRCDFDLAEVEMQEAIACLPESKSIHRDYCLLALAKMNPSKAMAEFMLATGLGEAVPYTDQEKDAIDARAAKLHYRKALSYGKSGRWPATVFELQLAANYAPDNANIKRSLAFAYANDNKFDLAETTYQETFEMTPQDAFSHADFAFMLAQEGKQNSAFDQIAKAVQLQPKVAALHIDLAWFAENKGDLNKAYHEVREAINLSPNHAGLWAHLGHVSEKQGDDNAAKDAYNKALKLDPDNFDAKTALAKLAQSASSPVQ